MPRILSILLALTLAVLLIQSQAWAKKAHPTTTTAPTTQEAVKSTGKEDAVTTHRHRAAEFANGKELDKAETQGKIDRLTSQVDELDKKLKDSDKAAAAEKTSTRHRRTHATTQPTTQETTGKSGKTRAAR
jgi:hypothetical protein